MTENIHGREVLRKMIESNEAYTQDTLRTSIGDWFGQAVRFHTRSTENMFADELISFLPSGVNSSPMIPAFGSTKTRSVTMPSESNTRFGYRPL